MTVCHFWLSWTKINTVFRFRNNNSVLHQDTLGTKFGYTTSFFLCEHDTHVHNLPANEIAK